MEQTAVEWFEVELESISVDFSDGLITFKEFIGQYQKLLKQAKEMEEKQIIDFGEKMQLVRDVDFDGNIEFIFNAEQYYNETFKQ
jgi:hypothetical protein